jgi:hypothetical protein
VPRFVRYPAPHGAVHDLTHWQSLDADECCLLLVSARTLYILQNWANQDVGYSARYASELRDDGYYTPIEGETAYAVYKAAAELLQSEVIDMACDVTAVLEGILSALESLSEIQDQVNVNVKLLTGAQQDQALCCGPASSKPYFDDEPGEDTNPETGLFCDRAWSYARNWAAVAEQYYNIIIVGTNVGVAILAVIAEALDLALAALLAIVSLIAEDLGGIDDTDVLDVPADLVSSIACAIYTAATPEAAKVAVDAAIDSYDWPTAWAISGPAIAKNLVGYTSLNKIFSGEYEIRADSQDSDCVACFGVCGLLSARETPFNVMIYGSATSGSQTSDANGYESYNSGGGVSWSFIFTPTENHTGFTLEFEAGHDSDEGQLTNWNLHEQGGAYIYNVTGESTPSPGYTKVTRLNVSTTLQAGHTYQLDCGCATSGKRLYYRRIKLCYLD